MKAICVYPKEENQDVQNVMDILWEIEEKKDISKNIIVFLPLGYLDFINNLTIDSSLPPRAIMAGETYNKGISL